MLSGRMRSIAAGRASGAGSGGVGWRGIDERRWAGSFAGVGRLAQASARMSISRGQMSIGGARGGVWRDEAPAGGALAGGRMSIQEHQRTGG